MSFGTKKMRFTPGPVPASLIIFSMSLNSLIPGSARLNPRQLLGIRTQKQHRVYCQFSLRPGGAVLTGRSKDIRHASQRTWLCCRIRSHRDIHLLLCRISVAAKSAAHVSRSVKQRSTGFFTVSQTRAFGWLKCNCRSRRNELHGFANDR